MRHYPDSRRRREAAEASEPDRAGKPNHASPALMP